MFCSATLRMAETLEPTQDRGKSLGRGCLATLEGDCHQLSCGLLPTAHELASSRINDLVKVIRSRSYPPGCPKVGTTVRKTFATWIVCSCSTITRRHIMRCHVYSTYTYYVYTHIRATMYINTLNTLYLRFGTKHTPCHTMPWWHFIVFGLDILFFVIMGLGLAFGEEPGHHCWIAKQSSRPGGTI